MAVTFLPVNGAQLCDSLNQRYSAVVALFIFDIVQNKVCECFSILKLSVQDCELDNMLKTLQMNLSFNGWTLASIFIDFPLLIIFTILNQKTSARKLFN